MNIRLNVTYFSDIKEWRVSVESGHYATAKLIEDIPEAVRHMLNSTGKWMQELSTQRRVPKEYDTIPDRNPDTLI